MGIYFFPSEFVYWTENTEHSKMKDKLMTKIKSTENIYKDNTPGVFNAFTSFSSTEANKEMSFLGEPDVLEALVFKPYKQMIKEYNLRGHTDKLVIDKCVVDAGWYTKYERGGGFKIHNHETCAIQQEGDIFKSTFSFIYILNDENENNGTEFIVPYMCKTSATRDDDYSFDTGDVSEIKEGSIIVFPSSLYHHVNPCSIPGRITISYNMKCCHASP